MRNRLVLVLVTALVLFSPLAALAAPIGPVYPAPGGNSFTSTGASLVDAAGKTRSYYGFDTSGASWSALYWNITSATVSIGTSSSVSLDTRAFGYGGTWAALSLYNNEVTWVLGGLLSAYSPSLGSFVSTEVSLETKFFQADGITALLASDFEYSVDGDGLPKRVLTFTPGQLAAWGGGFQVEQRFLATSPAIAVPLADFFNNANAGAGLSASTNAAFWYDAPTSAPVPEPASLLLVGTGLAAVLRRARRR